LLVLPPISASLAALWQFTIDGSFAEHLQVSMLTLALGMALSVVIGVIVGTAMGLSKWMEAALDVYVSAAMSAPLIAFVPIFIILFGIGYPTRVITVVIFAIFPIIINTMAGLKNADYRLVEMARSFGARGWRLFWHVRVPSAFPLMLVGIRLGTARGVKGLINGEVLIAVVGLGSLVSTYGNAFTMDRLYAVIFFLIAVALIVVALVDLGVRSLIRH
jgi:NitT/TauT family transport system permease protein